MACADILADLAAEYERSRALLEHLEDTLKDRTYLPAVDVPDSSGQTPLPDLTEERESGEEDEDDEEENQDSTSKNRTSATNGLRAKLANLFTRNRPQSTRVAKSSHSSLASDDIEEPKRRISVVHFTGPFADGPAGALEEPRRSVSFHPAGSNALLPTTALHRGAPRASLEIRQQRLIFGDTALEPRRLSSGNMGGFPVRRKSLDPFAAQAQALAGGAGRRMSMSIEVSSGHRLSHRISQAAVDMNNAATAAARMSIGQHQLLGSSPPTAFGNNSNTFLAPRQSLQQQQMQAVSDSVSGASHPLHQQLLGREDSIRRRSMSRRGSDNASGLSRGSSFTTSVHSQPQHPPSLHAPGSPVTSDGCLSPASSVPTGALPTLAQFCGATAGGSGGASASGGGRFLQPVSSATLSYSSLRAHSTSSMGTATGLSAAAVAAPSLAADDLVTLYDRTASVSATGAPGAVLSPTSASAVTTTVGSGASGTASPIHGCSSPQPQAQLLPQLTQRSRSQYHISTSSLLGPATSARRLQSFRHLDREIAGLVDVVPMSTSPSSSPEDSNGGGGRRQIPGAQCDGDASVSVSGGGGGDGGSFRGTMHLI